MNSYPQIEVPLRWFGQFSIEIGQQFDVVWSARIVQIEEPQIDVTEFGDQDTETLGGEVMVTLLLRDMRVPLPDLEEMLE